MDLSYSIIKLFEFPVLRFFMKNEINLVDELELLVKNNSIIPKPMSNNIFRVLRNGKRRGCAAVIYSIPNHKDKNKYYEKGITLLEFSSVLEEIRKNGFITRSWFNRNLPACAKEGSCNFTSLCGILELLGYVKYAGYGKYIGVEK